jgi:hypothetical protein
VLVELSVSAPPCGAPAAGSCTTLTTSALAADPRVHLDPTVHPDSGFDPPNRLAVIVVPVPALEDPAALADVAARLRGRGYAVKELLGAGASILAIVRLLRENPGFLLVSTHGNTLGQLLTGQALSEEGYFDGDRVASAQAELATELSAEGLGSLTTYKLGGEPAYYIGEPNCSDQVRKPVGTPCAWSVVVTPAFWSWLETSEHVDLSRSLVFISACETDATPDLRDQIKARAYFAFSANVAPFFADAVARYLADFLSRPTRSAEEAFYNMVRIGTTHQMIYKQDTVFQGVTGGPDASLDLLDGWGWNGSSMVSYRGNGWLSGKVDAGQVWWMLFAARWNTDAPKGAAGLKACYAKYWAQGNPGGLASPYCNAANAGDLSDAGRLEVDVDYAVYLLTGATPAGFSSSDLPPRWTLAD